MEQAFNPYHAIMRVKKLYGVDSGEYILLKSIGWKRPEFRELCERYIAAKEQKQEPKQEPKPSPAMNWIYNAIPNTDREVLVAFRAPETLETENVQYTLTSRDGKGNFLVPDSWKVIAWMDFPRCTKDADGKSLTHHWLNVEGLKL